jgi:hypothetical protein
MKPRHFVAVAFGVVALYVLSVGPATWLSIRLGSGYSQRLRPAFDSAMVNVYWPLALLGDDCPKIGDALSWYMNLWEPAEKW